jgi:hypothetical protein
MSFTKIVLVLNLISIYCVLTNATCNDLFYVSHSNLVGTTRVHKNFIPYMRSLIADLAVRCNAKVYVTSSFRSAGSSLANTVVPPASYSNHHAGYAIDFNLGSSRANSIGCNSRCLGILFVMLKLILINLNQMFISGISLFNACLCFMLHEWNHWFRIEMGSKFLNQRSSSHRLSFELI